MGEVTLKDLHKIVLSWQGTPFKHRQMTKGRGCDCFGFIRGVAEEYRGYPTEVPIKYSPNWNEVGTEEYLKGYLGRNFTAVESPECGNILLFNFMGINKHLGIMDSDSTFLHAIEGLGVVRVMYDNRWKSRTRGVYKI